MLLNPGEAVGIPFDKNVLQAIHAIAVFVTRRHDKKVGAKSEFSLVDRSTLTEIQIVNCHGFLGMWQFVGSEKLDILGERPSLRHPFLHSHVDI